MLSLLLRLTDNIPEGSEDVGREKNSNDFQLLLDEIMMLLTSRPRFGYVENIPILNASILNYGIDELFVKNTSLDEHIIVLIQRIKLALKRFEPRLSNVEITAHRESLSIVNFVVNATFQRRKIVFTLNWDDAMNQLLRGMN